ncbi:hypothetical protein LTR85_009194 [Meristemomyces frigidus]|nr:hypothetical protein LTR85_009194 [Meristemomyces frigidus]
MPSTPQAADIKLANSSVMASKPTGSPFQPRTLRREEATNDLRAHAIGMQHDNHAFAEAVEAHQGALLGTSPVPGTSLKKRRQFLHDEPTESTRSSANNQLVPQDSNDSGTSKITQISNASSQASRASEAAKAEYARHMAESTLTRNVRELMSKPTTMTSTWHVVWHNSARTRPLSDVLREVVEVRYPRRVSGRKEREGGVQGMLAEAESHGNGGGSGGER